MVNEDNLFSFELYISDVDSMEDCEEPSVAFCLLDYPTVTIRSKISNNASTFKKGKSCLFKTNFDHLNAKLQKVPLYVMLIDSSCNKPSLIGSCLISLADVLNTSKRNTESNGDLPSCFSDSGSFSLVNLMGSVVGHINMRFKFTCFGNTLAKHVNDSFLNKDLRIELPLPCNKSGDMNTSEVNKKINISLTQDLTKDFNKVSNKGCQINGSNSLFQKTPRPKEYMQTKDDMSLNDFSQVLCPPPLFLNLNLFETNPSSLLCSRKNERKVTPKDEHIFDYADDLSNDEEPIKEVLQLDVNKRGVYKNILKSPETVLTSDITCHGNCNKTNYMSEKLPLLEALNKEISKLIVSGCSKKDFATSAQLITDDCFQNERVKKFFQKENTAIDDEKIYKRNDRKKIKNVHKRRYGLTKTQKLRYQLTHENLLRRENNEKKGLTTKRKFPKQRNPLEKREVVKSPLLTDDLINGSKKDLFLESTTKDNDNNAAALNLSLVEKVDVDNYCDNSDGIDEHSLYEQEWPILPTLKKMETEDLEHIEGYSSGSFHSATSSISIPSHKPSSTTLRTLKSSSQQTGSRQTSRISLRSTPCFSKTSPSFSRTISCQSNAPACSPRCSEDQSADSLDG